MDDLDVDRIVDELLIGESRHRHINFRLIDPDMHDLVIPDLLPPLDAATPRPPLNGRFAHIPGFRDALKEAFIHGRSQPRSVIVRGVTISYGVEVEITPFDADQPIVVKN